MKDFTLTVTENKKLTEKVFELTLKADKLPEMRAGMFGNVEIPGSPDLILRRPFCFHSIDYKQNTVKISFDVHGKGTERLKDVKEGQKLNVLMPLGNSFPEVEKGKKILLVGGGTGVLPLLAVAQTYTDCEIYSFCGFASKADVMKEEEYKKLSKLCIISTDDGSYCEKGFVTAAVDKHISLVRPDYVFGCGPDAMMRCLQPYVAGSKIYVTMERRMGCGMGACLVCSCKTMENGETYFRRCCVDGPVFPYGQVFYE